MSLLLREVLKLDNRQHCSEGFSTKTTGQQLMAMHNSGHYIITKIQLTKQTNNQSIELYIIQQLIVAALL